MRTSARLLLACVASALLSGGTVVRCEDKARKLTVADVNVLVTYGAPAALASIREIAWARRNASLMNVPRALPAMAGKEISTSISSGCITVLRT